MRDAVRVISWVGRAVAVVVGVVLVGTVAVVAADAWRASGVRPPDCGQVLLDGARGDRRADADLHTAAWTAVADRDSRAVGGLDGGRPVLERSCLLYAGDTGGGEPSVVFAESMLAGRTRLFRLIEVRDDQRAATGYPVLVGSETVSGAVLPLTGRYLAPPDVTGVTVLGVAGRRPVAAAQVAPGVFDLGVVPDRSRAPVDQVDDVPAGLLLRRSDAGAPVLVAVPSVPTVLNEGGAPLRGPVQITIDGRGDADAATLGSVEKVLPLFLADRRLPALLRQAPPWPSLAARTAPAPGGRSVVLGAGGPGPNPGLPVFGYVVPDSGPAVAVAPGLPG